MVGTLSLTANGIDFTSSNNIDITNSSISVGGSYAVNLPSTSNSSVTHSTITGGYSTAAIVMDNSSSTTIDSNIISGNPYYGIKVYGSPNTSINYNTMDIDWRAIDADYNANLIVNNNTIRLHNISTKNYEECVSFNYSSAAIVSGNNITGSNTSTNARYLDNEYKDATHVGATIIDNILTIGSVYDTNSCSFPSYAGDPSSYYESPYYVSGILSADPLQIDGNTIDMSVYYESSAIYINNYSNSNSLLADQSISNNTINYYQADRNGDQAPLRFRAYLYYADNRNITMENNTFNVSGRVSEVVQISYGSSGDMWQGSLNILNNTFSSTLLAGGCFYLNSDDVYSSIRVAIDNVNIVGNTFTGTSVGIHVPISDTYSDLVIDSDYITTQQTFTAQNQYGSVNSYTVNDDVHYGIYEFIKVVELL
jgi:parallel beta-helix repeat protein